MFGPRNTGDHRQVVAPRGGNSARFQMRLPLIHSDDEDDDQDGGARLTAENNDPSDSEETDSMASGVDADDEDSSDDGGVLVSSITHQDAPIVVSGTYFAATADPVGSSPQPGNANGNAHASSHGYAGGYAYADGYQVNGQANAGAYYANGRVNAGAQYINGQANAGAQYINGQANAGAQYINGQANAGGYHVNGYADAGGQAYVNGYADAGGQAYVNEHQYRYPGYNHGDRLALHVPDNRYYGDMQDAYNAQPVQGRTMQHNRASILTCPTPCPSPQLNPAVADVLPTRFVLAGSESLDSQTPQSAAVAEGRVISHNDAAYTSQQEVVEIRPTQAMAPTHQVPVPNYIKALRSDHLNCLTNGPTGRPTLDVALDATNFPFIQGTTQAMPVKHGVVKIKNIPFSTKRSEIIAFLGRNSKILNDNQEPVHVIMERITSKTHDVYVEFLTMQDAMRAVDKHSRPSGRGKSPRLGDRPVDVELSSQENMMKDLFPLARGIFWDGSVPRIRCIKPREPWDNFKGFITEEEMIMLAKHVEVPQRSPFSRDCLQRAFECMISTIKKLPWFMAELVTIKQRYAMYKSTLELIRMLQLAVNYKRDETLTVQLLRRLVTAAMLCPGFTVTMKDDIAYVANLDEFDQRDFNQPRFADSWCHAYTLAPKPGIPLDVLEWYIAIIREETTRYVNSASLGDRALIHPRASATSGYFGYFWLELSLPAGRAFDRLTLADVASMEFKALERIFSRAFSAQG